MIDPWFLVQIEDLIKEEEKVKTLGLASIDRDLMFRLKRKGFSDMRLAKLLGVTEKSLRRSPSQAGNSARSTSASIPAPPSSPPTLLTCTRPTRKSAKPHRRAATRS